MKIGIIISKNLNGIAKNIVNKRDARLIRNILFLGNSYSEDTGMLLPYLCKEKQINCHFEMLVYPGCSINQHIDFITNKSPEYIHYTFDSVNNEWIKSDNKVAGNDILLAREWDYVVIQQCSAESGMNGTYSRVDELIDLVDSTIQNQNLQFIWNMTWAWPDFNNFVHKKEYYDNSSLKMHEGIINNVTKYIIPNKRISFVIPNGLVIYDAKNHFDEHVLFRDAVHLSLDIGRYIASLTAFKTIFGISCSEISFAPKGIEKVIKDKCISIAENYGDDNN